MSAKASPHLGEEDIERYCMGNTSEEETASFEEHLLICEGCRQRVAETDRLVGAMGRASARIREAGPAAQQTRWSPGHLIWVAAVAAAAAALLIVMNSGSRRAEVAVGLAAMRGDLMAHAPAGAPLALNPDLTGLPQAQSYDLELVDAVGRKVWRGSFPGRPVSPLRRGSYFVRLYAGGQLLREYGLVVQ